jgi:hypothetical protein
MTFPFPGGIVGLKKGPILQKSLIATVAVSIVIVLSLSCCAPDTSVDQEPMPTDSRVILLHHSTGGVIWGGGVPEWFTDYNSAHSTSYLIVETAFPGDGYPWANYPYDYWNIWINHAGSSAWSGQPTLEMLTKEYQVIVFKHCFPVSDISADTGSPSISSASQTIENYKLQYNALKAKLATFPSTRFVVWTGAALLQTETNADSAERARQFFDWVKGTWDEPGDNIYVWDFRALETDGGLYLLPEHSAGDSHPSAAFATEVAPYFCQRVIDVLEGSGDTAR